MKSPLKNKLYDHQWERIAGVHKNKDPWWWWWSQNISSDGSEWDYLRDVIIVAQEVLDNDSR